MAVRREALNRKTIERERLQAEAAAELSKTGVGDSGAAAILRAVMNDERIALHSRLDAAKALVREERGDDADQLDYVVHMPVPVSSLSEWFHLHDPDNAGFLASECLQNGSSGVQKRAGSEAGRQYAGYSAAD